MKFVNDLWAARLSLTLIAGVELDLFTVIAQGKTTAAGVAKAIKALVIAEMVPNDNRTGPVFPVLFGLNMVLHTNEGDVFTMAQYKQWLKQAGLTSTKLVEVPSPSPVILATR